MTWYVQQGPEVVTIYDAMDMTGNGNVRFRGTVESALTHFAFSMQECDELRKRLTEAEAEIGRLKIQLARYQ